MKAAAVRRETSRHSRRSVPSDEMGRPPKVKSEPDLVLSIRVPETLMHRLDAAKTKAKPGVDLSRTQVVILALNEWLDSLAEK